MNKYTDSFSAKSTFTTSKGTYAYFDLKKVAPNIEKLPYSIRVILEAVVRGENGKEVTKADVEAMAAYDPKNPGAIEVPYKPARVLLQDFTGVPCVVDLAAMRSAMKRLGGDPKRINPQVPVNLVIDHSIQVDAFNLPNAAELNAALEFKRNRERYEFLRWGQKAFENFGVVPPESGICHQVNLEYLAKVVQIDEKGETPVVYPDSLVGTDSHTPMINGLGVVGWGVGGIEAEANMLGQPLYMLAPAVVGVRLTGKLKEGVTATDLVLRLTEMLRAHGVVGKFVEYFGPGLDAMPVTDRATLSNMAPEYGATMGFCPIDDKTLDYMHDSGRDEDLIELVKAYAQANHLWRASDAPEPEFEAVLELDISTVEPALAGPKRPQDRISLKDMQANWHESLGSDSKIKGFGLTEEDKKRTGTLVLEDGSTHTLTHGDVVIAAITSCTNTSNPAVLVTAGLLAKKAAELGLKQKPWVKTSLSPGSTVVTQYLTDSGLLPYLEQLGFYNVGYGCTSCIGNSGPLPDNVVKAIQEGDLIASAVLSGNRNFEGRVSPHTKANYLASPPLVVAYALAGSVNIDLDSEPLGTSKDGKAVFLKDLWPSHDEITSAVKASVKRETFIAKYDGIEESNPSWNTIAIKGGELYDWDDKSTYIQEPPFFVGMTTDVKPISSIEGARVLVKAGDTITTDHISPAGVIAQDAPAGKYLKELGVDYDDFNSYGSRRGNDRIMTRGTFANIRMRNQLVPGSEGSVTKHFPEGEVMDIYAAADKYKADNVATIVLAGKDYGMGSSRDWAAKGVQLLGVKAVIAESYERIHRSNLIGMGVLPLQFLDGASKESLNLEGDEVFTIVLDDNLKARQNVTVKAEKADGSVVEFEALCRIDSSIEVDYFRNGGILHTVLRSFL